MRTDRCLLTENGVHNENCRHSDTSDTTIYGLGAHIALDGPLTPQVPLVPLPHPCANPEAPLLFVSTKSDDGHCPLTETQQEAMKEKYGDRFMGYFNVSAKANVNMTELLDSILSTAKSLPNMNETVPRSYHNLRNKIKVSAAERYLLTRRFAPLAPIARSIRA